MGCRHLLLRVSPHLHHHHAHVSPGHGLDGGGDLDAVPGERGAHVKRVAQPVSDGAAGDVQQRHGRLVYGARPHQRRGHQQVPAAERGTGTTLIQALEE